MAFWAIALGAGVYGFAGNPLPNFWGLLISSILVLQISIGLWLDGRYDPGVRRYALWLPFYPLIYWGLTAAASVRMTIPGLLRKPADEPVTWSQERYEEAPAPVATLLASGGGRDSIGDPIA